MVAVRSVNRGDTGDLSVSSRARFIEQEVSTWDDLSVAQRIIIHFKDDFHFWYDLT